MSTRCRVSGTFELNLTLLAYVLAALTTRDHADDAVNAIIPHWPLSLLVTAILTLWFCGVLLDMALEYIVLVRRVRRRSKGWSATAFCHVIVFVMVSCVLVLCALNTQQMFMQVSLCLNPKRGPMRSEVEWLYRQVMRSYKLELTISREYLICQVMYCGDETPSPSIATLRAEIAFFSIVDTLALCVAVSRVWIVSHVRSISCHDAICRSRQHSYNNVIWTSALAFISLVSVACYFAVLGLSCEMTDNVSRPRVPVR